MLCSLTSAHSVAFAVDLQPHQHVLRSDQAVMKILGLKDEVQAATHCLSEVPFNSVSRRLTLPSYTSRRHPSNVRSVVLPDPDGPIRMFRLPLAMARSTCQIACLRASPVPNQQFSPWATAGGRLLWMASTIRTGPPDLHQPTAAWQLRQK